MAAASVAITESQPLEDVMDAEPLSSKRAATSSTEDIPSMNNDSNDNKDNLNGKTESSQKTPSKKPRMNETEPQESEKSEKSEKDDDGFILVTNRKSKKKEKNENTAMKNSNISHGRQPLRKDKCEQGFIPQDRRVRLDFPNDTDIASKYKWLFHATMKHHSTKILFRRDEDNYIMVERNEGVIEDLLNTEYGDIKLKEPPTLNTLPRVNIIIFGLSLHQEISILEAHGHIERPKRLKDKAAVVADWTGSDPPPEKIWVPGAYRPLRVDYYNPPVRRCYKCQRWGHVAEKCRSKAYWCGICAGKHPTEDCKNRIDKGESVREQCINCHEKGARVWHSDCSKKPLVPNKPVLDQTTTDSRAHGDNNQLGAMQVQVPPINAWAQGRRNIGVLPKGHQYDLPSANHNKDVRTSEDNEKPANTPTQHDVMQTEGHVSTCDGKQTEMNELIEKAMNNFSDKFAIALEKSTSEFTKTVEHLREIIEQQKSEINELKNTIGLNDKPKAQKDDQEMTRDETNKLLKKTVPKTFNSKNVKDFLANKNTSEKEKQDILFSFKIAHKHIEIIDKYQQLKNG